MRENWYELDCLLEKHRITFGYSGSETASSVFKKQLFAVVLHKSCLEKVLQNSQENTCAGVSISQNYMPRVLKVYRLLTQLFSSEFGKFLQALFEALPRKCSWCFLVKLIWKLTENFLEKHMTEPVPRKSSEKRCFLKKSIQHWCFHVNFAKFLRTPFLKEHLRWLLQLTQSIEDIFLGKFRKLLSNFPFEG